MLDDENTLWTGAAAIREYYPYRIAGQLNPKFRKAKDGRLLDLKDNVEAGVTSAVGDFGEALDEMELPKRVRLAVVPGHEARPTNKGRGLARVVAGIGEKYPGRFTDASDALIRHTTIDKLAHGGDRDEKVHLNSIEVKGSVKGETVIVIDDVTTSGGTLSACRKLLLKAGAAKVGALALGRTTHT